MKRILALLLLIGAFNVRAYEEMYEATAAGEIEVKTLPARKAMTADGSGAYFDGADSVFMKLFRYIDRNNVSMTVPVESEVAENRMRFFVGADDKSRSLTNADDVILAEVPEQTVVSMGLRGGYTKDTYDRGVAALKAWVETNKADWATNGEPYAVYWNGPFMPGFMKKSEVHWPVESLHPEKQKSSPTSDAAVPRG